MNPQDIINLDIREVSPTDKEGIYQVPQPAIELNKTASLSDLNEQLNNLNAQISEAEAKRSIIKQAISKLNEIE